MSLLGYMAAGVAENVGKSMIDVGRERMRQRFEKEMKEEDRNFQLKRDEDERLSRIALATQNDNNANERLKLQIASNEKIAGMKGTATPKLDPRVAKKVEGIDLRMKALIESADGDYTPEIQAEIDRLDKQRDALLGFGLPELDSPPTDSQNPPPPPAKGEPSEFQRRAANVGSMDSGLLAMSQNPPDPTNTAAAIQGGESKAELMTIADRAIQFELGTKLDLTNVRHQQFLKSNHQELWAALQAAK